MLYGILFRFSLCYEHSNLEYVHIHVIYRFNQAEYVRRVLVAASQEYVNTDSTRRTHQARQLTPGMRLATHLETQGWQGSHLHSDDTRGGGPTHSKHISRSLQFTFEAAMAGRPAWWRLAGSAWRPRRSAMRERRGGR